MSVFYVQKSCLMSGSNEADSNLFFLRSDNPKRIFSVFGTLPSINSSYSEMDVYQFEVMDEVLADQVWSNARNAVRNPTHEKDEVDEFRKNDRDLERLFICAAFESED